MGRYVLITGVSSGIGFGLAKNLLQEGASVYGVSRRENRELLDHANFHFQSVDLAVFETIPGAFDKLLPKDLKLDLVILNAGILGKIADLQDTTVEEMQKVMDVNVWSNKVILDTLFRMGLEIAQVVTISSGAAARASRGWNAYSISKAALNMLTALYAAERPETHFCALAPGIVDTPMQEQLSNVPDDPRFDSLERLRQARGTELMPPPEEASTRLIQGIDKARKHPSGAFVDIDSLVKRSW